MSIHAYNFCISGFQPKQDFLDESKRVYDSEPAVLENLQQINDWVDNATNGKITDFLSSLPPNMLLMLINAVHYKGKMSRFLKKKMYFNTFMIKGEWLVESAPPMCQTFSHHLQESGKLDLTHASHLEVCSTLMTSRWLTLKWWKMPSIL